MTHLDKGLRRRLTPFQERMLSAGELAPEDNLEVIQLGLHLPTGVDVWELVHAWRLACARHELLGVSLTLDSGGGWAGPRSTLLGCTVRQVDNGELAGFMDRVLVSDARVRLDTSSAPHRLTWAPRPDGSGVLIWTVHHALVDGYSIESVVRMALEYYGRRVSEPCAPELMTGFFGARDRLRIPSHEDSAQFWRGALEGLPGPPACSVPLSELGRRIQFAWQQPGPDSLTLDGVVRRSTHVLAAAALLAVEVTGSSDVLIGNIYSQRPLLPPNLREMVGPFIGVLPLRVRIDRDMTVSAFLRQIREADLAARRFAADSGPEHVVPTLALVLNYQPSDWKGRIVGMIRAAFDGSVDTTDAVRLVERSPLPLVLDVDDIGGLALNLKGWSALHTTGQLRGMAGRVHELLEALAGSGTRRLAEVLSYVDNAMASEPGPSRSVPGTRYVAPRTRLEQRLAQIWAEVLHLDQVGVHDNFFDLGGTSLQAAKIILLCRAEGQPANPQMVGTVAAQAEGGGRACEHLPFHSGMGGTG